MKINGAWKESCKVQEDIHSGIISVGFYCMLIILVAYILRFWQQT